MFVIIPLSGVAVTLFFAYLFFWHQYSNPTNDESFGADIDHDGVWDDVGQWIQTQDSNNPRFNQSLELIAQDMQWMILHARDSVGITEHAHNISDPSIACAFRADSDVDRVAKILHQLEAIVLSTPLRRTAYEQASANIQAGIFESSSEQDLVRFCGF